MTVSLVCLRTCLGQGLAKLLADSAPQCSKEQKFEDYFGRKIAIDASMHIYQFLVMYSSPAASAAQACAAVLACAQTISRPKACDRPCLVSANLIERYATGSCRWLWAGRAIRCSPMRRVTSPGATHGLLQSSALAARPSPQRYHEIPDVALLLPVTTCARHAVGPRPGEEPAALQTSLAVSMDGGWRWQTAARSHFTFPAATQPPAGHV